MLADVQEQTAVLNELELEVGRSKEFLVKVGFFFTLTTIRG